MEKIRGEVVPQQRIVRIIKMEWWEKRGKKRQITNKILDIIPMTQILVPRKVKGTREVFDQSGLQMDDRFYTVQIEKEVYNKRELKEEEAIALSTYEAKIKGELK